MKKTDGSFVKITDLKNELSKLHIPKDSYSIDDIEDESLCLILDEGVWCVFIVNVEIARRQSILQMKTMLAKPSLPESKNGFSFRN
jgi:hypothetical protein